jgi:chitin disaccharide deacetylase
MNRTFAPDRAIVTADDFGLSTEVNEAVERAHREGVLSAASLMVAGPAAEDAVRRARSMPSLRVGLHVALIEDRPAAPAAELSRLCDDAGRFRSDMFGLAVAIAFDRRARRQLEREIRAQFEAFERTGLPLDHVDAHKHFHLHPTIAGAILRIGREFRMRALRAPIESQSVLAASTGERPEVSSMLLGLWARSLRRRARRAGLVVPDWVFGLRWTGAMNARRLVGLFDHLPFGLVEIYLHPATRDDFPGSAPGYRYVEELQALCDPDVRAALVRSNRVLGGYGDAEA